MGSPHVLVRVKVILADVSMWPQQSLLSRFLQKVHFRSARRYAIELLLLLTEIIHFHVCGHAKTTTKTTNKLVIKSNKYLCGVNTQIFKFP